MTRLDTLAPLLLLGLVLGLVVALGASIIPTGLRWSEQLLLLGLQP